MESLDFQAYPEFFGSVEQEPLTIHSLAELLAESLDDDNYDLNDESSSESEDNEDVIDIETIDELEGVCFVVDDSQTFTSARTAPIVKRQPTLTDSSIKTQDTATVTPTRGTQRARLNSEQIVNELAALQEVSVPAGTCVTSEALDTKPTFLEPSLDPTNLDGNVVLEQLEKDDFSLLDIDGIEADDLESLFMKFEGVTGQADDYQATEPQSTNRNLTKAENKSKLTLEDYRKLRGLTSASVDSNVLTPAMSVKPIPRSLSLPLPQTSQPATAVIRSTSVSVSNTNVTDISTTVSLDHDYCIVKSVFDTSRIPSSGISKPTPSSSHQVVPLTKYQSTPSISQNCAPSGSQKAISSISQISDPSHSSKLSLLNSQRSAPNNQKSTPSNSQRSILINKSDDRVKTQRNISTRKSAENIKQERVDSLTDRDYKSEIITLLNRIPQYLDTSYCNTEEHSQPAASCDNNQPTSSEPLSQQSNQSSKSSSDCVDFVSDKYKSQDGCQPQHQQAQCLPRAYSSTYHRSHHRSKRHRRRHRSSSVDSYHSASSISSSDIDSDSSSASDYDSSSCSSCNESRSRSRHSHKKSRRKNRYSKKQRVSSRSRSLRGRHKCKQRTRRRHKSGRSSQSVSPYSSSTSARSRSPSPTSSERERQADMETRRKEAQQAHNLAMGERRVVYVGGIGDRYGRAELRKRFGGFGEIERVSIHTRDNGENYGFVTFYSKADAYAAVEKGNDVYGPKFNIGFGGRRLFCDTEYADLDGCQAVKEEWAPSLRRNTDDDFDALLKRSMKTIRS